MHLKSLTLKGFKSFASATTLKFEPGICAVVGPNGSGKSNVVDALAWVMGEQGAKTLRGGKMEDVIFAGTSGRKPLGRAEVTLTIDNTDGALPIQYREVSVTRRMFRDGASEYEINGSRCRLMDVQELLSDSGIGREMHIIVGQGRLSQILEARPEERRSFIEEAAGVLKHRRRKEKAQRKLASMQANLDRLTDLTTELRRQLKPLARQAEAAKRAQTVQADLRDAKLRLAAADLVELRASLNDVAEQARIIQAKVDDATMRLEIATERRDELEAELERVTPLAESARELWFRLSALSERVGATRRIAADRAADAVAVPWAGQDPDDLEARADVAAEEENVLAEAESQARERLETIRDVLAEAEEEARAAEHEHLAAVRAIADRREGVVRLVAAEESVRTRLQAARDEATRLDEQFAEADDRRADAAQAVEEAAAELAEAELAVPELRESHERAQTEAQDATRRVQELRNQERALEREISGYQARIEALTAARDAAASDGAGWLRKKFELGSISELLSIEPGWDTAIAAALGSAGDALVANGDTHADAIIAELTEAAAGHAVVVQPSQASTWRLDVEVPADCQWALDAVQFPDTLATSMTALLVDVVLCPDPESARSVVDNDNRLRAVTADGSLFGPGWVMGGRTGGSKKKGSAKGTAQSGQSSVEISAAITQAEKDLAAAKNRLADLAGVLSGATQEEEDRRTDAAAARAALRDQEHTIKSLSDARTRAQSQLASVEHSSQRATERREEAAGRVDKLTAELEEVADRLSRIDDDPAEGEPSTEERDRTQAALAQARAMETEARLALRTAEERAGSVRGKADRLRRAAVAERAAKARHEQTQLRKAKQRELAATVADLAEALSGRVSISLDRAAADRDEQEEEKKLVSAALQQARNEANQASQELAKLTDSAHQGDLARAEAQVRVNQAEETVTDQLGLAVDELLADYTPDEEFDRAATVAKLKQAEKDLRVLGRVNPLALEEYKAMEERYTFLSTQLDDVQRARKDLLGVVEEVDDTILQLFTDAWHDVEAEFPKVFNTLFPGGEGRLVLTEPDDMLTTGIEVEARPPGKKVKRLSLLSGGEKSLTTLAMLVAIFRARPSPFYVLDEVEAALDDVNLRRLIALLKELRETSQLIVITHQKPTMDVANVLYGVTMQGDGVTRVISQRMSPQLEAEPVSPE
ncbi:chromosome segregation protein SMC [Corynebacterium sp. H78]|uniref:chromosome segregation protein SMC n=1 Tax=Corynebacterium sp. H78 TaxID=3133417 RepID=UPI0030B30D49